MLLAMCGTGIRRMEVRAMPCMVLSYGVWTEQSVVEAPKHAGGQVNTRILMPNRVSCCRIVTT